MEKLNVGIVFGGQSTEHEISLQSATNIANAIDKNRFKLLFFRVDKQGKWNLNSIKDYLKQRSNLESTVLNLSEINVAIMPGLSNGQFIDIQNFKPIAKIDVIFPIIHGANGENGSLQGMLRMANIPFVGSDVQGSSVCMDKDITKRLLRDAGFNVAPFVTIDRIDKNKYTFTELSNLLGIPFFIKPANQGSSIGLSKVSTEEHFYSAIRFALEFDHKMVVEKEIKGREIECAILGNSTPIASTCGEIILKNDFYSYHSKYTKKENVKIVVPAILDPIVNDKIRSVAIKVYQTLGCCGMARVDVFLTKKNRVIINEVNTIPGFTDFSMYPKLWKASGISCSNLITRLIDLALEKHNADSFLKNSIINLH